MRTIGHSDISQPHCSRPIHQETRFTPGAIGRWPLRGVIEAVTDRRAHTIAANSEAACHRHGAPNMKIVVIGGTGLSGSKTVAILRQGGNEVVAASPKKGINAVTGEGLKDAVAGATVVVDLANSPSFDDRAVMEFFETSGRNLLAAEAAASVRHHVALTIVGTARTRDNGYFRAKVAQEIL